MQLKIMVEVYEGVAAREYSLLDVDGIKVLGLADLEHHAPKYVFQDQIKYFLRQSVQDHTLPGVIIPGELRRMKGQQNLEKNERIETGRPSQS